MKNARCWARKFDSCSPTISGEHKVSVAAWPGDTREERLKRRVFFRKGDLRPDGTLDTNVPGGFLRPLTVNTFTANVLCVDHNHELSPTEKAAGAFTKAISDFYDTWKNKRAISGLPYAPKVFEVDGPLIERWFIKTVITNMVQYVDPIGGYDAEPGTPTDELVDIAFGNAPTSGHIQLHGAAAMNWRTDETDDFGFMEWYSVDPSDPARKFIAGAICEYRGFRFVMNLDKTSPPPMHHLSKMPTWKGTRLMTPLKLIEAPRVALAIRFNW